jgi:hypothetical protein
VRSARATRAADRRQSDDHPPFDSARNALVVATAPLLLAVVLGLASCVAAGASLGLYLLGVLLATTVTPPIVLALDSATTVMAPHGRTGGRRAGRGAKW